MVAVEGYQIGVVKMAEEVPKKDTAEASSGGQHLSDSELLAAYGGPAFHINKMYTTAFGQIVRISFMEQLGEKVPPQFRTAIVLSFSDAVALRDLLSRQIGNAIALKIQIGPDGKPIINDDGE
jgi:hypothetical protein